MKRLSTMMILVIVSAAPAFATRDAVRNAHEAAVDNRQIATDHAWIERDRAEVAAFEQMVASLADAQQHHKKTEYQQINIQVRTAMEREIEQARVKRAQAVQEQGQSRREARNERMEASATGSPRDAMQAADDRHDLRDDRRDQRRASERFDEMKRLGELCASLQTGIGEGNRDAMGKNVDVAQKFLALMRDDLSATTAELHEDKVERREDRRERRTDRRQSK